MKEVAFSLLTKLSFYTFVAKKRAITIIAISYKICIMNMNATRIIQVTRQ